MPANTHTTGKRKANSKSWKKGQPSPNPAGRPKDGESWAAIIKKVGDMYPTDIVAFIGANNDLGKMIGKFPKDVQMKYLVTARVFADLMFDPNPKTWVALMDRAEGKVKEQIQLDGTLNVDNLLATLNKVYGTSDDNSG